MGNESMGKGSMGMKVWSRSLMGNESMVKESLGMKVRA